MYVYVLLNVATDAVINTVIQLTITKIFDLPATQPRTSQFEESTWIYFINRNLINMYTKCKKKVYVLY